MPDAVDLSYAIGLPPEDAINYLRKKGYAFSWDWHDVWQDAHAKAFTVAKAMKLDILKDIRKGVDDALANGKTFQDFQNDLTPLLQKKGWWGKVDGAQLGSPPRLNTIFRTNLQSSYMAGRYKQQLENADDRPYWQYIAVMDSRTRPAHSVLNGKVFRFNDPFWDTHFPPNGYRCRCRTRALTEKQVKARGLDVETGEGNVIWEDRKIRGDVTRPVAGYRDPNTGETTFTDPGWSSNPGKEWARWDVKGNLPDCSDFSFADGDGRCIKMLMGQKTWKDFGRPDLRAIQADNRTAAPELLGTAKNTNEAVDMLSEALGVSAVAPLAIVKTPIDDVCVRYEWLYHLVEKRSDARERYANFIVPTLVNPYEIWLTEYEDGFRSRYVGLFTGVNNLMVVIRVNQDGSLLWNIMQAKNKNMNKMREGELLWGQ